MALAPFSDDHPLLATPCVWHPGAGRGGYSIVHFRTTLVLDVANEAPVLWVSAVQRFLLYVDGRLVARGPSRSPAGRRSCARVALGPLAAGPHILCATVAHFGEHAGQGELGGPAFFVLWGENDIVRTGGGWRCFEDRSRSPLPDHAWGEARPRYDAAGAGERVDGALVPWGYEQPGYDDAAWPQVRELGAAGASGYGNYGQGVRLGPDPLPPMVEREGRFARVALAEGPSPRAAFDAWALEGGELVVPPGGRVRALLDRGELVNAYTRVLVSGGRGGRVRVVACEAPFADPRTRAKGDRDRPEGKIALGRLDEYLPDGGAQRAFAPLWFRAYRYLEISAEAAGEPLVLGQVTPLETGYPLTERASFRAEGDPDHRAIWQVSVRTARRCAHETFLDGPHYEQLQYVADARVQAVFAYLVCDDDRLARKAVDDLHLARSPEGLVPARAPARHEQIIPPFSLHWVGMLYDLLTYRGEAAGLARYLPAVREVLAWFARRLRPDGLLGPVEYWNFFDWSTGWERGQPPSGLQGGSAPLTLLFAEACGWARALERACGYPELASRWGRLKRALAEAALRACFDAPRGLLSDAPGLASFSVHTQTQAVLAGALNGRAARVALVRALDDPAVTQPGTLYYRYHIAQALKRAGLRERVVALFAPWRELLRGTGLTTWPEREQRPRSDCHGWSVTPAIEYLQTVLGVEPAPGVEGFSALTLRPALGALESAEGAVPTPQGEVRVRVTRAGGRRLDVRLVTPVPALLPAGRVLPPGTHDLRLNDDAHRSDQGSPSPPGSTGRTRTDL
jgi:alpha-L-rhamnosidase